MLMTKKIDNNFNDQAEEKLEKQMENKSMIFLDRFKFSNINLTNKQKLFLNKLCDTNELYQIFMAEFYNKSKPINVLIYKFRAFKLKNHLGQTVLYDDMKREINNNSWYKVLLLCEDLFQEHIELWEFKMMIKNLANSKYKLQEIFDNHWEYLCENFICIIK